MVEVGSLAAYENAAVSSPVTTIERLQGTLNGLGLKAVKTRLESLLEQAARRSRAMPIPRSATELSENRIRGWLSPMLQSRLDSARFFLPHTIWATILAAPVEKLD